MVCKAMAAGGAGDDASSVCSDIDRSPASPASAVHRSGRLASLDAISSASASSCKAVPWTLAWNAWVFQLFLAAPRRPSAHAATPAATTSSAATSRIQPHGVLLDEPSAAADVGTIAVVFSVTVGVVAGVEVAGGGGVTDDDAGGDGVVSGWDGGVVPDGGEESGRVGSDPGNELGSEPGSDSAVVPTELGRELRTEDGRFSPSAPHPHSKTTSASAAATDLNRRHRVPALRPFEPLGRVSGIHVSSGVGGRSRASLGGLVNTFGARSFLRIVRPG